MKMAEGKRLLRPVERQPMRDWLMDRLDGYDVPGCEWVDRHKGKFHIKWCHGSRHGWSMKDVDLFERWAKHTGKTLLHQYSVGPVLPFIILFSWCFVMFHVNSFSAKGNIEFFLQTILIQASQLVTSCLTWNQHCLAFSYQNSSTFNNTRHGDARFWTWNSLL